MRWIHQIESELETNAGDWNPNRHVKFFTVNGPLESLTQNLDMSYPETREQASAS
jgi:phenylalanyl-tRNA synthetase beta subunit